MEVLRRKEMFLVLCQLRPPVLAGLDWLDRDDLEKVEVSARVPVTLTVTLAGAFLIDPPVVHLVPSAPCRHWVLTDPESGDFFRRELSQDVLPGDVCTIDARPSGELMRMTVA